MGTLYIDRKDIHIRLDGNALAFYVNGDRDGTVPIGQLKRVVVVGKAAIDTPVLHRLAEENISVIFLSGRSMKFCGMLHGRLHNNAIVRLKQYEKSTKPDFALQFSSQIVREKLKGQITLLDEIREHRKDIRMPILEAINTIKSIIEKIDTVSSIASLMGLEGGASATYFSAFTKAFAPSLNFTKRTRRPPKDPVNAMLSLCYTMLHFEMVREIELIGLDPTIGFYHQFEYGRESLASDLVETYRVEVDRLVYELFRSKEFGSDDFYIDEESQGYYLKKEGRKRFYPLYEEWAKNNRPTFAETVKTIARRLTDEQDTIHQ
ncbi:MAG: CRISPR-associated endonuclease Cas1 [Thermodesulfovibrionales bacterium]|nr:CRISPR-associated endonuclease Cas1 [Thermodesulfovibrionales bacterium]